MASIYKNELKEEIGKFYNENRNRGKNFTVKHFQKKMPKSSIYRIIKRKKKVMLKENVVQGRNAKN